MLSSILLYIIEFDFRIGTLTSRISELSAQMEVVISWIQRSGELSARLNNIKHSMTDINSKETIEQTIQAKLQLIKVSPHH